MDHAKLAKMQQSVRIGKLQSDFFSAFLQSKLPGDLRGTLLTPSFEYRVSHHLHPAPTTYGLQQAPLPLNSQYNIRTPFMPS